MRSLANYIESLMSNEGQIMNVFFERESSGFHVTKKVVMETPNPWPQVFFIFFVFLTVIMTIYFIIKSFY
jgi:hypothetical protein